MSHFAEQVEVGVCRVHNALSQFQCDPYTHPHDLAPQSDTISQRGVLARECC
jgi:hypothetical protein